MSITNKTNSFEAWFQTLKDNAVLLYGFTKADTETFDAKAWKNYYDSGYTPGEAMQEDMSYA